MKIKSCIRKKLLASLLIGLTLSSTVSNTVFALDNSRTNNSTSTNNFTSTNSKYNSISDLLPTATTKESRELLESMMTKTRSSAGLHINDICFLDSVFIRIGGKLYMYNYSIGVFVSGLWTFHFGNEPVTFYFDPEFLSAARGWCNVEGHRYYFNPKDWTAVKDGFHTIDGTQYLFNYGEHPYILTGINKYNGKTYYTDSVGRPLTGWREVNGERYYFDPNMNGAAYTGWYKDWGLSERDGSMYFLDDGRMAKGVTYINGDYYLFKPHGNGKNFYKSYGYYSNFDGKRYYFDQEHNGKAAKDKWYQTGRGWIHFNNDGSMSKGVTRIKDKTFVFTQSYARDYNFYRDLGWYTDKSTGKRYYFGGYEGEALTGFQFIDGKQYYFNEDGSLLIAYDN